jgi:hypothetical protein
MGGEEQGCGPLRAVIYRKNSPLTGKFYRKNSGLPLGRSPATANIFSLQLREVFWEFLGSPFPFSYQICVPPKLKSKVPFSWLISGDLRHLLGKNFGQEFWARIPRGQEFWARIPPVGKNFGQEFLPWAKILGKNSGH